MRKSPDKTVEKITIHYWNVYVNRDIFCFAYQAWINGKPTKRKTYSSRHTRSVAFIKKSLKNGFARELVLQQLC